MRQFAAMLKDSFKEAVDGFVIYVMLAFSALVIVVVGSRSDADGMEDWGDEEEAEGVPGLPDVSAVAVSGLVLV